MKIGIVPMTVFVCVVLYGTIVGWVMCFHASVVLGFISLFVQGAGFFEWLVFKMGGYDVAFHLARALGLS